MILKPIGNLTKHSWPVCLKAVSQWNYKLPIKPTTPIPIAQSTYNISYDPDDTSPPNHPFLEYATAPHWHKRDRLWQYLAQGQSQWTPYWFTDTGFGRNWNRPEYRLCWIDCKPPPIITAHMRIPTDLTTCDAALNGIYSNLIWRMSPQL